jgi:cellulose biosynthesis protein BcsQ
MPTVVFANRKGGVGKTLSTLYTGRWLARAGRDVTLVDLDPQKSLWDIAALLGRPEGVFTQRLRLASDGKIPAASGTRSWVLVDTPPALDGSLPALQQTDYVVIPVIPEAQEVAQLEKFLTMFVDAQPGGEERSDDRVGHRTGLFGFADEPSALDIGKSFEGRAAGRRRQSGAGRGSWRCALYRTPSRRSGLARPGQG